jgi:hypothetical protein
VNRARNLSGAFLIGLGALSVVEGFRLRDDWLGAKLMPVVIGAVLLVLGFAHVFTREEHHAPAPAPSDDDPEGEIEVRGAEARNRVAFIFAVLAIYVIILPSFGFMPATAVFTLTLIRALGSYSWAAAFGFTVAIAVSTHVVFKHWLGMPLPVGRFGV